MHLKLIFCVVLLQLLLTVDAGEEEVQAAKADKEFNSMRGESGSQKSEHDGNDQPQKDVQPGSLDDEAEEAKSSKGKKLMSGTKISRGLAGAAECAVAVDMTRGWCRYLPRSTRHARWTVYPRCNCGRCNMRGVMKICQPYWARVLTVFFAFENPIRYTFNLGNSPTNDAWGGDGNVFRRWDAEMHNWFHWLFVWRNQWYGNAPLYVNPTAVQTAMLIRIYSYGVYITNFQGVNVFRCSNRFFKMYPRNCVYVGLNRVIKHAYGSPSPPWRIGSGLCFMTAFWSG